MRPAGDHRRVPHRAAARSPSGPGARSSRASGAQIIIREVPYQHTRNRLAEQIGELVKDERIKGIDEVRDESSPRMGEPVRIVIDLKKDVDPHLVLNQLYEYSPLQKTVSIILLALVDGRPQELHPQGDDAGVPEAPGPGDPAADGVPAPRGEAPRARARRAAHRHLVARRGHPDLPRVAGPGRGQASWLQMAVAAALLRRAIGDDGVHRPDRANSGRADEYHMTEQQAEAVVRLQLGQLAALERDEILKEYAGLREQITRLRDAALRRGQHSRGHPQGPGGDARQVRRRPARRRSPTTAVDVNLEDLIAEEDVVVTSATAGTSSACRWPRSGRSTAAARACRAATREDDFVEHFFVASTHAYLLCFTNRGQCHWLKVYDIPEAARTSGGPVDRQRADAQGRRRRSRASSRSAISRRMPTC